MKFTTASVLALVLASTHSVSGVLYGDEQFGDIPGGRFWAFHSAGVSIVNPESCSIDKTFSYDKEGSFLPNSWFDGVYMQSKSGKNYVMINSGVTKFDGHENLEGGAGEVLSFSTHPKDYDDPVKAKVTVGGRPVHSYAVYPRDEFWTHSDADGFFYVIKLDDISKHTGKPIQAKVDEANHGKLLWDEDSHLNRHGFATSTGETHVFIIDMLSKEQIGTYDFSGDVNTTTCHGTHAIAYSNLNKHLYVECTGEGGALELDVSDPVNPKFVTQHDGATGALYETPDEGFVVASDKGGNKLHVFRPNGNGTASSIEHVVNVPGHPSTVSFWPIPGDKEHSFIACMPLTENTNRNHMDANGNIVCDYYGCSGASTAEDVANGICHYDETGRSLQEATIDQIEQVRSGAEPFGAVCTHCEDEKNYQDGICECTPFCGSCADADYDATNSGVSCVNLYDVVNGRTDTASLIKGAGSVLQGSPYAYSPQCGFGRTYRTHKRGGIYDASVAHFPSNSLQIVNMETQTLHCAVDLPGAPSRVVYVPPQQGQNASSSTLSAGGIAGIVIGSLAAIVIVGFLVRRRRSGRNETSPEHAGGANHSSGGDDLL